MHPLDDPVYRPRKLVELTGLNYYTILDKIDAGEFGPKIHLGKRAIGVRASGYRRRLKEHEAKPEAA